MNLFTLLQTLQWGDTAFPSGRYTLSHGLEGMVQRGLIATQEQASDALRHHIREVFAPGDGAATALTIQWVDETDPSSDAPTGMLGKLIGLDRILYAQKTTHFMRRASTRVGKQMLGLSEQINGQQREQQRILTLIDEYSRAVNDKIAPGNQAVVAGLIHALHGADEATATAVEGLSLAMGWSSAALRLRLCDHIGTQSMVTDALGAIEDASQISLDYAQYAEHNGLETLGQAAQNLDVSSAMHEHAPARLFLS